MKCEILIFGYYGKGNLGDEANLQRLLLLLKAHCPERKITVIAANPERVAAQLGIRAISRINLFKIGRAMQHSRFLIGGCGNVFQDRSSLRSLVYYSGLIILAKLQKCRVILYGQGIGPIHTRFGKWIASRTLSLVDQMIVRDRVSVGVLCELGAARSEFHFTAEPLLALDEIPTEKVRLFWKGLGWSSIRKIGLVVQENNFTPRLFWKQLMDGLLLPKDTALYLISIDQADGTVWREMAFDTGSVWMAENADWERLQGLMGGFDLIVSVKLHGLVAAVNQGIPCFGLAIDPKIEGFCLQFDIPCYLFTVQPEPYELAQRILNYLERPLVERLKWLETRNYWKVLARESEKILLTYLKAE